MAINIAINGFGRIGRNVCRALFEGQREQEFNLVAINDLGDAETNAHLLQYDTTHGKFNKTVTAGEKTISIDGHDVKVFAERDPSNLPWGENNIDVVLECTGLFRTKEKVQGHLDAGAKKVLISAPGSGGVKNIVYGVNHDTLTKDDVVAANASCTTNALAPMIKPLHDKIGVVSGIMNTVHSYTNDQALLDVAHSDLRRARAAAQSMIPTATGAAQAIGLVIPELEGKFVGFATRVPTPNVSLIDMTMVMKRETTKEEIVSILENASQNELKGVLAINKLPLVSSDFNHNPASSIFDESLTFTAEGNLVKICSWYDNEWGFSNRMLDTTKAMVNA